MFRNRSIASITIAAVVLFGVGLPAQDRPMSPLGTAATQVGGHYVKVAGIVDPQYQGGQWIEVTYSRPIKRSRDVWGTGADYGKNLLAGAPVWRAGANVSTRLKTDVPLVIEGKTVAPGEYSLFIDLKPQHWTLIVSNWAAQSAHDPKNKDALWGAFNYTADKDVVRAPMTLSTLPVSVDELTWAFTNMSDRGGGLTLMWDRVVATAPFAVR
jgi:hypothetical protein